MELLAAEKELGAYRPGITPESVVRLGELRRRQGLLEQAEELCERASSHALSLLGRSAIALDYGDSRAGVDFAERFLRRHSSDDKTDHAKAIELLVEAHLALGELSAARDYLGRFEEIADFVGTVHLQAEAAQLRGLLSFKAGKLDEARRNFADSADLYERIRDVYMPAVMRFRHAKTLRALGYWERARHEAQRALETSERLGAMREAEELRTFLADEGAAHSGGSRSLSEDSCFRSLREAGLTLREEEILRLIVAGKDNQEIADILFLSVRTAERHLSNLYLKIGVAGKSARAAAVADGFRHGLM